MAPEVFPSFSPVDLPSLSPNIPATLSPNTSPTQSPFSPPTSVPSPVPIFLPSFAPTVSLRTTQPTATELLTQDDVVFLATAAMLGLFPIISQVPFIGAIFENSIKFLANRVKGSLRNTCQEQIFITSSSIIKLIAMSLLLYFAQEALKGYLAIRSETWLNKNEAMHDRIYGPQLLPQNISVWLGVIFKEFNEDVPGDRCLIDANCVNINEFAAKAIGPFTIDFLVYPTFICGTCTGLIFVCLCIDIIFISFEIMYMAYKIFRNVALIFLRNSLPASKKSSFLKTKSHKAVLFIEFAILMLNFGVIICGITIQPFDFAWHAGWIQDKNVNQTLKVRALNPYVDERSQAFAYSSSAIESKWCAGNLSELKAITTTIDEIFNLAIPYCNFSKSNPGDPCILTQCTENIMIDTLQWFQEASIRQELNDPIVVAIAFFVLELFAAFAVLSTCIDALNKYFNRKNGWCGKPIPYQGGLFYIRPRLAYTDGFFFIACKWQKLTSCCISEHTWTAKGTAVDFAWIYVCLKDFQLITDTLPLFPTLTAVGLDDIDRNETDVHAGKVIEMCIDLNILRESPNLIGEWLEELFQRIQTFNEFSREGRITNSVLQEILSKNQGFLIWYDEIEENTKGKIQNMNFFPSVLSYLCNLYANVILRIKQHEYWINRCFQHVTDDTETLQT